jgi:heat shock protein HtpX
MFSLFLVVVIFVGWIFSYAYNDPVILYIAVFFSLFTNLVAYWKSDKIALAMSGAQKAEDKKFGEIYNIVENLSITAGVPMPSIYIINDPSPNAFATGRNPKNASIAITTGLLDILDRSELEGVIAHELSHIKNYDILISTVAVVLVGLISIISDFFMRMTLFGRGGDDNKGKNPVIMIVAIAVAVLAPILGTIMRLSISRRREFLADASGVLLTRYPEGLASALEKISKTGPSLKPHNATAHLFISSPFRADSNQRKTPWLAKLFMTHPPIDERIKSLRQV